MPGIRGINHTKIDPRTRRAIAMFAQEAGLIFGDGLSVDGTVGGIGGGSLITINLATPSGLVKSGGLAIDPKASGGMAIDTDGLYIVLDTPAHGLHMSLGASGLSIDDDYVFNTGDSMTGALDITDTSTQLTLKYDGGNTVTFTVSSGGDLTIAASGGDISLGSNTITTTGLGTFGNLDVDTLNLNDNKITDSTGAINFDDERLEYEYGNIMDPSIVGWWEFLNTAEDKSLEGNDGTLANGASITLDPGVLLLDGNNDHVTLNADTSLDIEGEITISAWVKIDTAAHNSEYVFFGAVDSGGFEGYATRIHSNKHEYFSSIKGAWVTSNTTINDGEWHHIVVSVTVANANFYLDGVADGTPASNYPGTQNAAKWIGCDNSVANLFDGNISNLMILNRALTADEVNKLYSDQNKYVVHATHGAFSQDVIVGRDLYVTRDAFVNNDLDVSIDLTVGGDTTLSGDLNFGAGSGGLTYGEISAISNAVPTTIAVAGTSVQVTIFDTDGPSNGTSPDHTNDHIIISKAGHYFISISATINSIAGAASKCEITCKKNNGAANIIPYVDRNLAGGAGEAGVISISGIADLAISDTIEVWIENETNTQNYIVEDICLSLIQIGGT